MVHYGTTAKEQAGLDEGSCCRGVVLQSSCVECDFEGPSISEIVTPFQASASCYW